MGMQYFIFWDGICLIRRIVRKYNWKNVTLLGHSLGGALTFMYAASFPTEVEKLINIDIAGPTVRGTQRMAEGTGRALDKFLDYETLPESKQPCYSYDEMIKLVLDAYDGSVDEPSVRVLMNRGMRHNPSKNGYLFARDLRLKVSLLGMFTAEQTLAYARQIRCRVLNIRGIPGMKFETPQVYADVTVLMDLAVMSPREWTSCAYDFMAASSILRISASIFWRSRSDFSLLRLMSVIRLATFILCRLPLSWKATLCGIRGH